MSEWWMVVEYESVDVSTAAEELGSSHVPGEPWTVTLCRADRGPDAIREVALHSGSGFYQAVALPENYRPQRVTLEKTVHAD